MSDKIVKKTKEKKEVKVSKVKTLEEKNQSPSKFSEFMKRVKSRLLGLVWLCRDTIQEKAGNYDNISWYKSYRYIAVSLMLVWVVCSYVIGIDELNIMVAGIAVLVPLGYLVARGNRGAMITLIILFFVDLVLSIFPEENAYKSIIPDLILVVLFLHSFRIEIVRRKTNKPEFFAWFDIIIPLSLFASIGYIFFDAFIK